MIPNFVSVNLFWVLPGDWIVFTVYFFKYIQSLGTADPSLRESEDLINSVTDWLNVRFKGYWNTLFWSTLVSYLSYFGVGGFLHVSNLNSKTMT
jgi:hypothetical protein